MAVVRCCKKFAISICSFIGGNANLKVKTKFVETLFCPAEPVIKASPIFINTSLFVT